MEAPETAAERAATWAQWLIGAAYGERGLAPEQLAAVLRRSALARRRSRISARQFVRLSPRELRAFAARHGVTVAEARLAQLVAEGTLIARRVGRVAALVRSERDCRAERRPQ